jgi:uncharacterized OB-fold protein
MRLKQRTGSHFQSAADGLRLIATRGASDAPLQFPPQSFIHGDQAVEEVPIGPQGVLYTYSVVHPGRDKATYGLAMVDFAPGVRAFGRLLLNGGTELRLGASVRVVPFELPDGEADYAFEAVEEGAQ